MIKGLDIKGIVKIAYDVAIRPAINQVVKIGTNRTDSFNFEKYGYDVVTRGLTTFAPSPWKAFYRSGFRSMWDHIFTLLCGIVGSIIMIINYKDFVESVGMVLGILFLTGIVALFSIMIVFSTKVIVILLKDAKSLNNNNYISIIGKVLNFKKNRDSESGAQINDKPIILILDTSEVIELIINDKIMIGETYQFHYLKNCKIAEVVEKI